MISSLGKAIRKGFLWLEGLNCLKSWILFVFILISVSGSQTLFTGSWCHRSTYYRCQILFNHEVSCANRFFCFVGVISSGELECGCGVETSFSQSRSGLGSVKKWDLASEIAAFDFEIFNWVLIWFETWYRACLILSDRILVFLLILMTLLAESIYVFLSTDLKIFKHLNLRFEFANNFS